MLDITTRVREVEGATKKGIPGDILDAHQPVILKGFVAQWPSVRAGHDGTVALLNYLRGFSRDQDVLAFKGNPAARGRYFYNEDLTGFNFERITARLDVLLAQMQSTASTGAELPLYLGSTAIDAFFPGFRQHNDIALDDSEPLVSIWIGNRSRIAAHFDTPANVACVVAGRRRFTLFPPEQLPNLYIGPLDFTPAGQAISMVDFEQPDYATFPRFRDAVAAAQVAELEPGDALYLPSMWWHHVEALDAFNVLVNYWWNPGRQGAGNPLNALIHALLSVKGLPAGQRKVWRDIFEHYVFSDDAGAFDHIPQDRRGVLGDLDADTVRQLRSVLRNKV